MGELPSAAAPLSVPLDHADARDALGRAIATLCRSLQLAGAAIVRQAATGLQPVAWQGQIDLAGLTVPASDDCGRLFALRAEGRLEGYLALANPAGAVLCDDASFRLLLGLAPAILRQMRLLDDARERERARQHEASRDALTGLPNRSALDDHLRGAVALAQAQARRLALLLLDIDRFREVNDTLGHRNGDALVRSIAERLMASLDPGIVVARLGGDEFALLLPDTGVDEATAVATGILETLAQPFSVDGHSLMVDVSIGVAVYPDHGLDADTLLRLADVAMYVAKRANEGLAVYAPELDMHSADRLSLLSDLRRAIAQDQFFLCFQPQLSMPGRRLRAVEALVRWRHPRRGLIPPDDFIALAEWTGAIKQLTLWVLDAALRQCRGWRRAGIHLPVSVNLSARNLLDATLPLALGDLLDLRQVPADDLILEITESTIMGDPERAMAVLTQLSGMGIRLAIDDFGTGYSSLTYLKRLPANEIKIDKSFVFRLSEDHDDAAIVRSIIDLGHNLGLQVVAEGVENRETWGLLSALGCDLAQGYHISPPLPPPELERWLAAQPQP